jgi:hypothetical protein
VPARLSCIEQKVSFNRQIHIFLLDKGCPEKDDISCGTNGKYQDKEQKQQGT